MTSWPAGEWLNPPPTATVVGDDLFVTAAPGSDFWQETSYGFRRDSGHALLAPFQEGRAVEVSFIVDYGELYDQAGLLVRVNERTWIKAGIEVSDGSPQLSAVVTHGTSDWSVAPVPNWAGAEVTVRASWSGGALTLRACPAGHPWRLLRLAPFLTSAAATAGPYCCAPEREGLTVRFTGWRTTDADAALHGGEQSAAPSDTARARRQSERGGSKVVNITAVCAPSAFKGTLSARMAASAMARGVRDAGARAIEVPVADGGDGTLDVLLGSPREDAAVTTHWVAGPLGAPVRARLGRLAQDSAVVELAEASGFRRLGAAELDALHATSRGTGELIRCPLDAGITRIVVGVGGSPCTDGGAGLLQVLGAHLVDARGAEIGPGGAGLEELDAIDLSP